LKDKLDAFEETPVPPPLPRRRAGVSRAPRRAVPDRRDEPTAAKTYIS